MPDFKCKMCGGSLELSDGLSIAVCEYCGTKQTVPKLDTEKRTTLYQRADHFRRNNDFDKAIEIYEEILKEDNSDAEAYWLLVLCRYGIEYVEDSKTLKRIPTINRVQHTSILADEDYKSAVRHADNLQKGIYEQEARQIDAIQKEILAISKNEKPFDVFICYKETDDHGRRTPDSVLATELYYELEREGFKVFFSRITLENKLGTAYEPYIFAALNSAKVMVALGTKAEYFNSPWVKNEWSRYLALIKNGAEKTLIPAYRDMNPYYLPEDFSHLQALDMSKLGFAQDLIRGIKKIIKTDTEKQTNTVILNTGGQASVDPLIKRAFLFLEDGDWQSADDYCEKVLDLDPECALAYIGKMMVQLRVKKRDDLANCEDSFEDNTYYLKAVRFGDDQIVSTLNGYIAAINTRKENERKEAVYKKGMSALENAQKEMDYIYLIRLFESIAGYKNSDELVQKCTDLATEAKNREIYFSAISLMKKGDISNLQNAISQFEKTPDFRDSDALMQECHRMINDIKAEEEYTNAIRLMKIGTIDSFKNAVSIFEKISDYKDSDALMQECRKNISDINTGEEYASAVLLMKHGKIEDYKKAISVFEKISYYKDSSDLIKTCQKKIDYINSKIEYSQYKKQEKEKKQEQAIDKKKSISEDVKIIFEKYKPLLKKISFIAAALLLGIALVLVIVFLILPKLNFGEDNLQSSVSSTISAPSASLNESDSDKIKVTVPNVVGIKRDEAVKTLENLGLVVSVSEQQSDTIENGLVISQSVDAEQAIASGAQISIVVSTGKSSSATPSTPTKPTTPSTPTPPTPTPDTNTRPAGWGSKVIARSERVDFDSGDYQIIDYNAAGQHVSFTCYDAQGKKDQYSVTIFDSKGDSIGEYRYSYVAGTNTMTGKSEVYFSPNNGDIIKEYTEHYNKAGVITYKYSKDGNESTGYWYDDNGVIDSYHKWDANGYIIERKQYTNGILWIEAKWEGAPNGVETTIYYDENGNITDKTIAEYKNGSVLKMTTYDANGNITEVQKMQYNSDGSWVQTRYDGKGKVTRVFEYDGKKYYTITCYDENGNVESTDKYDHYPA